MTDVSIDPGPGYSKQGAAWSEPLGNQSVQGVGKSLALNPGVVTTDLIDIAVDHAADPQVIAGEAEVVGIDVANDYYHALVAFEAKSVAGVITPVSPPNSVWQNGIGGLAGGAVTFTLTQSGGKLRLNVVTTNVPSDCEHQGLASINQKTF